MEHADTKLTQTVMLTHKVLRLHSRRRKIVNCNIHRERPERATCAENVIISLEEPFPFPQFVINKRNFNIILVIGSCVDNPRALCRSVK